MCCFECWVGHLSHCSFDGFVGAIGSGPCLVESLAWLRIDSSCSDSGIDYSLSGSFMLMS